MRWCDMLSSPSRGAIAAARVPHPSRALSANYAADYTRMLMIGEVLKSILYLPVLSFC
jgi:hypothetical protein